MKIIKVYTVNVSRANHYRDTEYEYFYRREDAYQYLCGFAQEWNDYEDSGYDDPASVDVGYISCNLVPILDNVTLPEDPAALFFDDSYASGKSIYLDIPPYTDFVVEHDMPYGGDFWTLFADGHIVQQYHDGRQSASTEDYINGWKSRGWDGTVEEVIL